MKRRLTLLMAAVGLVLSVAPGTATADSMARAQGFQIVYASDVSTQAFADCPNGYGCFWVDLNGRGTRWDAPSCGIFTNFTGWLNNNFESVRNRGGGTIHFYDASDAVNGYMTSVVNNGQDINLYTHHRNKTSSLRIDC